MGVSLGMATVSISEAANTLPALLQRARSESVVIEDEAGDKSLILSLKLKTEEERMAAVLKFEQTCHEVSAELAANLAKEGISVEDFLADLLADD